MTVKVAQDEQYAAIGFSTDKQMGYDDVWACLRLENSTYDLIHSRTVGHENIPSFKPQVNTLEWFARDGWLECSFTRENQLEDSDLEANEYYLIVVHGLIKDEEEQSILSKHVKRPLISNQKINFTAMSSSAAEESVSPAKKAHGMLMLCGWIGCASVAIILARYFKPMWPNSELLGVKVWFLPKFIHAVFGCLAVGLGLINPILAFFRPNPTSPKRFIFNWTHWAIGTSAYYLAVVNVFFAMDMLHFPHASSWVFLGWLIFHVLVEVFYEILNCVHRESDKFLSYKLYAVFANESEDSPSEVKMKDVKPSEGTSEGNPSDARSDETEEGAPKPYEIQPNPSRSTLRVVVLGVYVLVTIAVITYIFVELCLL
ncbi:ferric-chelate reductase 1-like [Glandiceps talaboti]